MKKNYNKQKKEVKKTFSVLFFTLLIVIAFPSYAISDNNPDKQFIEQSQKRKVSLQIVDSSLDKFFIEICRQTNMNYVFDVSIKVDPNKKYSLSVSNIPVASVLRSLLAKTPYTFRIEGDKIIVTKKTKMPPVKIKGKVLDKYDDPIVGATIILAGTNNGAISDSDGDFEFKTPHTDSMVLDITFVGMEPFTVAYTGQEMIIAEMKESNVKIEDVVVTGYANISRSSFTGNARTVTAAELKNVSPTNVLKALEVLDPSFRLKMNNEMGSNPNALPEMSIRGASGIGISELDSESISKANLSSDPNLPTFIMDGFEVSMQKVYDMDVNRIQSLTMLKDAAATAIYGSRAANGVIVITTVPPKAGEILVSYSYNLNFQTPDLSDYNLMNVNEKIAAEEAAGLFDDNLSVYNAKMLLVEQGVNTDWMSLPLRNTASSKHYVKVEGGNRNLRYAIDANYHKNNGVMKGSDRLTNGVSFELQYSINKLIFRNTAGYTGTSQNESPYGQFSDFTSLNPYLPYADEYGTIQKTLVNPGSTTTGEKNPMYEATLLSYDISKTEEFYNNLSVQYHLNDKINFKANIALTRTVGSNTDYDDPQSQAFNHMDHKGELNFGNSSSTNIDGGIFGYYNNVINKHYINVVAGVNVKSSTTRDENYFLRDLPLGGFTNPQFAADLTEPPQTFQQVSRLIGAMTSMNYTYDNIYLFDLTGRLDGSSSFGTESKFAPFWSTGVGVNVHNYSFMKSVDWVSELKVRGSYGITGKANFPTRTARTVYTIDSEDVYATGIGGYMQALGNKNLKWEKTKIADMGINLNLFDGMFAFNGSYYNRRTVDLIADMFIPSSSGFLSYKDNVGEMVNKGFEIDLRFRVINTKNTTLFISGSMAKNDNKIVKISESMKSYNEQIEKDYASTPDMKPILKYVEGASVTSIYAVQSLGIDPQTGKELYRNIDGSVSSIWVASENIVVGNTDPKINGSFYSNLRYKGFSFDLYFTYRLGGQQYNQTLQSKVENADIRTNVDKRVFYDRWQKPGDISQFKSIEDYKEKTHATSRFVQDDNTLNLSSITFGYDLPTSIAERMHFNSIRCAITMNDVFQISSIKQERGLYYPYARGFNFSVNVSF